MTKIILIFMLTFMSSLIAHGETTFFADEGFQDLTDWENLDFEKWTSFTEWKTQRAAKDKMPEWRTRVRNIRNREIVGRLIKCIGRCDYYRGVSSTQARAMTVLREGDELTTGEHGLAWLMLVDGTLFRLSSKTSLTFNEVNLSKKKVHFLVRLNTGHIQFESRMVGEFKALDRPETDLAFSPLIIKEANREFYAITNYKRLSRREKLNQSVVPNIGFSSQYAELNKRLLIKKDMLQSRDSKIFFYTANHSLLTQNTSGSIFYSPAGLAYFKVSKDISSFTSHDKRAQSAMMQKRGYDKIALERVAFDRWYEVDKSGTYVKTLSEAPPFFEAAEGFLKRIPMIHLAREILLAKHSFSLLDLKQTAKSLAKKHGYRLWNNKERDELFLREAYLKEYVRRTETTNLKSFDKLPELFKPFEFDKSFSVFAFKRYYKKLKNLYSLESINVRKLSLSDYYLWLLRESHE